MSNVVDSARKARRLLVASKIIRVVHRQRTREAEIGKDVSGAAIVGKTAGQVRGVFFVEHILEIDVDPVMPTGDSTLNTKI